jgi:hypothetical protein
MRRWRLLGIPVSLGSCKLSRDVWYLAGSLPNPQLWWAQKCRVRGGCGHGLVVPVASTDQRTAGKVGQAQDHEGTLLATGAISRVRGAGQ